MSANAPKLRYRLSSWLKGFLTGLFLGLASLCFTYNHSWYLHETRQWQKYQHYELTPMERDRAFFKATVPPMDVIIHFWSPKEFQRRAKDKYEDNWKGVYAWSQMNWHPCEINMRAGFVLFGNPHDITSSYEGFLDPYDEKTVAHELLHCIAGAWHGQ